MKISVRKILNAAIPGSLLFVTARGYTIIVAPAKSDETPFHFTICEPDGMARISRKPVSRTALVNFWVSMGIDADAECEEIIRSFPERFEGFEVNPTLLFLPYAPPDSCLDAPGLYLALKDQAAGQRAGNAADPYGDSGRFESRRSPSSHRGRALPC